MNKKKRAELLSEFNKGELESIHRRLNYWGWDKRLGKAPFMFDAMERYKKPHNLRRRFENFFRAIWPFTKSDYIEPIIREIDALLANRYR